MPHVGARALPNEDVENMDKDEVESDSDNSDQVCGHPIGGPYGPRGPGKDHGPKGPQ